MSWTEQALTVRGRSKIVKSRLRDSVEWMGRTDRAGVGEASEGFLRQ